MTTPDSTPASADSVMAAYKEVVHAIFYDEDSVAEAEATLRAEVERLAAQSAPTELKTVSLTDVLQAAAPAEIADAMAPVVAQSAPLAQQAREYPPLQRWKLRRPKDAADHMAKDDAGDWVRYEDVMADRAAAQVEPRGTDAQILFERKLTCEAIQGAMAFGYQGTNPPPTDADHWLQPFWDIGNRTRQLEQAATLADFHRIMAMSEAEVDAELRSLGIDPDKAAERADRAIKGALVGAQVKPKVDAVRMLTREEFHDCLPKPTHPYEFRGGEFLQLSWLHFNEWADAVQRTFCRVNRSRVIPADGEVQG